MKSFTFTAVIVVLLGFLALSGLAHADSNEVYVKYPSVSLNVPSDLDPTLKTEPNGRYARRAPFLAGALVGASVANHHQPSYYAPNYYYPSYPSSGYYYNNNGYYYTG